MGRRKIEIKAIKDDRNRSVTFLKRKGGLFKKAHELSVLCSVDVAVFIFGTNKKLYEYSSSDMHELIQRHTFHGRPTEHKGPGDFNGRNDDEDDEDDMGSPRPDVASDAIPSSFQGLSPFQHARHRSSPSPPPPGGDVLYPPQTNHLPVVHSPQPQRGSRPASRNEMGRLGSSIALQHAQHSQLAPPGPLGPPGPPGTPSLVNGFAYISQPPIYQSHNQNGMVPSVHQSGTQNQYLAAGVNHSHSLPQHGQAQVPPPSYDTERICPPMPSPYLQPAPPRTVVQRPDLSPPRTLAPPLIPHPFPVGHLASPSPQPRSLTPQMQPSGAGQIHLHAPSSMSSSSMPAHQLTSKMESHGMPHARTSPPRQMPAPQPESNDTALPLLLMTAIKKLPQRRGHSSIFTPIDESRSILSQHFSSFVTEPSSMNREPKSASLVPGRPHANQSERIDPVDVKTERSSPSSPPLALNVVNGDTQLSAKSQSSSVTPPQEARLMPISRSDSFQMLATPTATRPRLTVQIPEEGSEGVATPIESPLSSRNPESSPLPAPALMRRRGSLGAGVVLPPPSPSASTLLSAGASGPPNPFARPPPQHSNGSATNLETPMSALPSRFLNPEFLPSPSSFWNEWQFRANDAGMLPSPLNLTTPLVPNGPSFLRDENSGPLGHGKRKSPDLGSFSHPDQYEIVSEPKRVKVE